MTDAIEPPMIIDAISMTATVRVSRAAGIPREADIERPSPSLPPPHVRGASSQVSRSNTIVAWMMPGIASSPLRRRLRASRPARSTASSRPVMRSTLRSMPFSTPAICGAGCWSTGFRYDVVAAVADMDAVV
ncbi:hypothetical protein PQI51_11085 [Microbacterium esteraromaticum]|uniref:hypothetical protein n=1 Tax=Microbacterium esteraromaticum TaxID=57043 RepID=UPI0030B3DA22